MAETIIRLATSDEAHVLTEIALRSKAHWGYARDLLDLWADDLRVTPASCDGGSVWIIVVGDQIVGFGELLLQDDPAILDDLFIDPAYIGQGFGSQLLTCLLALAQNRGASAVEFDAEPHAVGFYERYGARTIGERASAVVPGRTLPIMRIDLASTTIGSM